MTQPSTDQKPTTATSEQTTTNADSVTQPATETTQETVSAVEPPKQATPQRNNDDKKSKIKKILLVLLILAVIALVAFGLWKSYQPKWVDLQGRVEAETIHVSTKLPSRIE